MFVRRNIICRILLSLIIVNFSCQQIDFDVVEENISCDLVSRSSPVVDYSSIFNWAGSRFSPSEKNLVIWHVNDLLLKYSEFGKVLEKLSQAGSRIRLEVDSNLSYPAAYDFSTDVIYFKSDFFITGDCIMEELLHALQKILYGGFLNMFASRKNIEYEVKVFRDILEYRRLNHLGQGLTSYWGICEFDSLEYQGSYRAWIEFISWKFYDSFSTTFNSFAEWWQGEGGRYNVEFPPLLIPNILY